MNGLSSSAKSGIHTILKYKFHIINIIAGQAGKLLAMLDIPGEWFVKLSQDLYSYGIKIYISHIYCKRRPGWQRFGNARHTW